MALTTAETDQMKCIAVRILFSSAAFCLQKYYTFDLRFEKGHCKDPFIPSVSIDSCIDA